MQEEISPLGPRPDLLRAIAGAALLWGLTLVLPVRVEFSEAVWASDLLDTQSGLHALGASAFAGLGLLLLSLGTHARPASSRALVALTLAAVGLAGLMCDPETQSNLLVNLPAGLARGYVAFIVAVASAAAALRTQERSRSLILFGVSLSALTFVYLWPHPFGALWQHATAELTRVTLDGPYFRTALTSLILSALPAGLVMAAILGRLSRRPVVRNILSAWIIGIPSAILLVISVRLSANGGVDAHALVGLRSAAVCLSLILTCSYAAEVFTPHAPTGGALRFRVLAHGLSLAGLALALTPHLQTPELQTWAVSPSPGWALQLYTTDIPNLARAATDVDLPGGEARLETQVRRCTQTAQTRPDLVKALRTFALQAQNPGENRRALRRTANKINNAARSAGLPFYLDLQLIGSQRSTRQRRWSATVKTYRIEQARRFQMSENIRSSLWLSRLDASHAAETRLGWTGHDAQEGMVMLDVVRDHWRQDLLPALVGQAAYPQMKIYSRHARTLSADLAHALAPQVPADALGKLLECAADGHRNAHCLATRRAVEPRLLHVLAQKVEAHELRHAADGARLPPPTQLLELMHGHSEQSVHFAASELSAYLAEVASCPVPRLALTHFYALAKARPRSPEGFAGRVAFDALAAQTGLSAHRLIDRPAREVAKAAAEVHHMLFGRPLYRPRPLEPLPLDAPNRPSVLG